MTIYSQPEVIAAKERADQRLISFFEQEIPTLLGIWQFKLDCLTGRHSLADFTSQNADALLSRKANAQEVAAHINGGFLNVIHKLYTEQERDLITDISGRFKRVKLGFAYFSLLPPSQRVFETLRLTEYQLRTGWQRTGIPVHFNQTVGDHQRSGHGLAHILFPDDRRVAGNFIYHDAGEGVIGDFTPHDTITREEKAQIESLGVRLATHTAARRGHPLAIAIKNAVELYDGDAPEHAELRSKIKDCDLLEMVHEMIFAMGECPAQERLGVIAAFQEFWDYIAPRLTHPRAINYFDILQTARSGLIESPTDLFIRATKHMQAKDPDGDNLQRLQTINKPEPLRPFLPAMSGKEMLALVAQLAAKRAPT